MGETCRRHERGEKYPWETNAYMKDNIKMDIRMCRSTGFTCIMITALVRAVMNNFFSIKDKKILDKPSEYRLFKIESAQSNFFLFLIVISYYKAFVGKVMHLRELHLMYSLFE
jgi:hypothetical protein